MGGGANGGAHASASRPTSGRRVIAYTQPRPHRLIQPPEDLRGPAHPVLSQYKDMMIQPQEFTRASSLHVKTVYA